MCLKVDLFAFCARIDEILTNKGLGISTFGLIPIRKFHLSATFHPVHHISMDLLMI